MAAAEGVNCLIRMTNSRRRKPPPTSRAARYRPRIIPRACLDRIAAVEGDVQAFVHLDPDHALAQARVLDRLKADGDRIGPLHGIPVAIKDIFDTADYPTEYGSPIFAGRRPTADATVVRKLREAGAVIIGKTVTTEFAYFNPGKTRNPRDLKRTPGGSSSGSAAAVAAGMVPLAIGSQTNGSMIRPAAFCGVFGVKPSHGLISRGGALTLSRTLDHVGAFARSIEDLALVLDVLVGQDSADPDTRGLMPRRNSASARLSHRQFRRALRWCARRCGRRPMPMRVTPSKISPRNWARERSICRTHYRDAWSGLRAIMAVEMAHNLGDFVDNGGEASKTFRELIAEGRKVTATEYLAAIRDARRYADGMASIFEQLADAIITLSARGVAPLGIEATGDPVFCTLWTLTGFPSLNVPLLANADGLPIGVQLVGAPGRDERLLRTARALVEQLAEAE